MTAMAGRRRARRRTARGREDPAAREPEDPGAAFARDLEAVMVTFLTASRPACSGGGTSMRPSSFTGAARVQSGAGGTGPGRRGPGEPAPQSARSPGNRRARHLTREIAG